MSVAPLKSSSASTGNAATGRATLAAQPSEAYFAPRVEVYAKRDGYDKEASDRTSQLLVDYSLHGKYREQLGFFKAWSTALAELDMGGAYVSSSPELAKHVSDLARRDVGLIVGMLREEQGHPAATSLTRQLTAACEHLGINRNSVISQDEVTAAIQRGMCAIATDGARVHIQTRASSLAKELGESVKSLRKVLVATGLAPGRAQQMAENAFAGAYAALDALDKASIRS